MDPVPFLTTDELSMIRCLPLTADEWRCREYTSDSTGFFRSLFIYLLEILNSLSFTSYKRHPSIEEILCKRYFGLRGHNELLKKNLLNKMQ